MKSSTLIKVGIGALIGIMLVYTFGDNDQKYFEFVNKERSSYKEFLKNSDNSPLKGLKYKEPTFFQPDVNYKIIGTLERFQTKKITSLSTSDGDIRPYFQYGRIAFNLNEKECNLTLFQNSEDETDFFLPFKDLTNGKQTYGSGRYLPIQIQSGNTINIDFNLAINPYCAYNLDYSCPYPPKSNHLNIQVLAGETYSN